jgi:cytochrome c oxidase subunit 3
MRRRRKPAVVSETHAPVAGTHGAHHAAGHDDHGHGHHGALQHQFDDLEQQRDSNYLGMWLFLATEIMMFGGLFFTYTLYRTQFEPAFFEGCRHLNITLGTINTFVLLFSSLTMALGVHYAVDKKPKISFMWLGVTWLLGAAFLGIKAVEWTVDYHEGLIPAVNWSYYSNPAHAAQLEHLKSLNIGPQHVQLFFTVYFCMTGLHAIHMIVGLIVVGWFMWLTHKGHFLNGNDQPVEIVGLYWHIVDIVWVLLFPLLYLIAGFHPFGGAPGGGH